VERSGDLVTKHELLERVWPNVIVEEAILARNVADLRKALGDDSSTPRYIETLPKRGYRFVAEVAIGTSSQTQPAALSASLAGRPVDTLQLVAESPVQRPGATLVDAPELTGRRLRGAKVLGWVAAVLLCAGVAAWLIWR
jgi:DNA-binding winged helix-turn-helix (wHTH) protein